MRDTNHSHQSSELDEEREDIFKKDETMGIGDETEASEIDLDGFDDLEDFRVEDFN